MDRLRSTFKRSRTPTGAEMKTQNSLEVPKQVRSVSFDEIKLGCAKRDDEDASKERTAGGGGHPSASSSSSLRVPAGGQQRSRSFDSSAATTTAATATAMTSAAAATAAAAAATTSAAAAAADRDDSGVFLEVPSSKHQLFHRRRSSGEKVPAGTLCVHCAYLEELSKMNRSSSGDENHRYRIPGVVTYRRASFKGEEGCRTRRVVTGQISYDRKNLKNRVKYKWCKHKKLYFYRI